MTHLKKAHLVTAFVLLLSVGLMIAVRAAPNTAVAQKPWLSNFLGDPVIVTFITTPPDMSRTTKAVLMDVGHAGVVLRFGRDEIFFSFANVITIEPAP